MKKIVRMSYLCSFIWLISSNREYFAHFPPKMLIFSLLTYHHRDPVLRNVFPYCWPHSSCASCSRPNPSPPIGCWLTIPWAVMMGLDVPLKSAFATRGIITHGTLPRLLIVIIETVKKLITWWTETLCKSKGRCGELIDVLVTKDYC